MESSISENKQGEELAACHECDLLLNYSSLEPGSVVVCPRCGYVVTKKYKNAMDRLLAFASSAVIFLFMSNLYPFLTFSSNGHQRQVTLLQSIEVLADEQQMLLATMIIVVILLIPAAFLSGVLYVIGSLKYCAKLPHYGKRILRLITELAQWSMVEIFLIGTLVSLVKIASLATITLGMSFWAYILFAVFMTLVLMHLDKVQVWQWVDENDH